MRLYWTPEGRPHLGNMDICIRLLVKEFPDLLKMVVGPDVGYPRNQRLRLEDNHLEVSMGCLVRACLKKPNRHMHI